MLHQERFVLVDREPRPGLIRIQLEFDPSFCDPPRANQVLGFCEQPNFFVIQIDRINVFVGHRRLDAESVHQPILVESDDRGTPAARLILVVDAVQINKINRLALLAVAVGHAIFDACADKTEMGIRIGRLVLALRFRQFHARRHVVVPITFARREKALKRAQKSMYGIQAIIQAMG